MPSPSSSLPGKPVQAALFGVIMAGVYAQSGNLWLAVGAHAAFNALSELPLFATSGLLVETYVTGQPRRPGRAAGNDRVVRSALPPLQRAAWHEPARWLDPAANLRRACIL